VAQAERPRLHYRLLTLCHAAYWLGTELGRGRACKVWQGEGVLRACCLGTCCTSSKRRCQTRVRGKRQGETRAARRHGAADLDQMTANSYLDEMTGNSNSPAAPSASPFSVCS